MNQKYCSLECRDIHTGRAFHKRGTAATCILCGRSYFRKYGSEKYCSAECKHKVKQERQARAGYLANGWAPAPKHCAICGTEFIPRSRNHATCSEECRQEYARRAYRERERNKYTEEEKAERLARWDQARRENFKKALAARLEKCPPKSKKPKPMIAGTCVVCGQQFTTLNPAQKTCSKECGRRLANSRKSHRIKKEQIIDKDITLEALYRRDSGVCYLCGGLCDWGDRDKEKNVVGANYPSIDHIIPISRGGLHAWNNVRLAHFRCNVEKSNTLPDEAESLIPSNAYELKKPVTARKTTEQCTKSGELVAVYPSAAEAARKTGLKEKGIQNCARGELKTYGGFVWKYAPYDPGDGQK
jgi:5-methylcytosine-specific restriction endonuclease McrA